jgi:hypothetical protein
MTLLRLSVRHPQGWPTTQRTAANTMSCGLSRSGVDGAYEAAQRGVARADRSRPRDAPGRRRRPTLQKERQRTTVRVKLELIEETFQINYKGETVDSV